jgi:sodium/hydrogen exchanger-like protein 6/7
LIALFGLMLIFFVSEALFEKCKCRMGHQTGVTVICGVILSICMHFALKGDPENYAESVKVFTFSETVFFDLMLPPIIFNSGYNMRQKKFFQNIGNVSIFGIGVTFVCFTMYSAATYGLL